MTLSGGGGSVLYVYAGLGDRDNGYMGTVFTNCSGHISSVCCVTIHQNLYMLSVTGLPKKRLDK